LVIEEEEGGFEDNKEQNAVRRCTEKKQETNDKNCDNQKTPER